MNLNDLADALTNYTDAILIAGPYRTSWAGKEGAEIHVSSRLGDGREVTVASDGTVRWMHAPAGGPHRPVSRRLPVDVEQAAERVAALVWSQAH